MAVVAMNGGTATTGESPAVEPMVSGETRAVVPVAAPVRTVAVACAKGGSGKSTVAVNLATALGEGGHEVLLLDGNLALGDIARLLDLVPEHDLSHVMRGECALADVLLAGPGGVTIAPGATGVSEMASLSRLEHAGLIGLFGDLPTRADTLVVDLASGFGDSTLAFAQAVRDVVVVVCEEPAALHGAAATIRVLHERCRVRRFRVVANRVASARRGLDLYAALAREVERHADALLDFCGSIPSDPRLAEAAASGRPVVEAFPRSPAALAFRKLATRVAHWPRPSAPCGHVEFFVERLIGTIAKTSPRTPA